MTSSVADLYRAGVLPIRAGLFMSTDREEARRMQRVGWTYVGVGTDRRSGLPVHILEPALH